MRQPGIIFDLDGTLVDSVYQHVASWHSALSEQRMRLSQWRIHRAIGMSGRSFLPGLLRDEGYRVSASLITKLETLQQRAFSRVIRTVAPLPGAAELMQELKQRSIPFAIATTGGGRQVNDLLRLVIRKNDFPVVTADDVAATKPAPDLFELAADKLQKSPNDCFIVGDSIWDVLAGRRMNSSVVALRTGGFDGRELQESGAYRVYADPLELARNLEQLGLEPSHARATRK
jgi:HAD superfamily hydrolase (TIGR01509 family)